MNTGMRRARVLSTCLLGLALGVWSIPTLAGQQTGQSGQSDQNSQSGQSGQSQPSQGNKQGSQAAGQPSGSAETHSANQKAANLINTVNQGEIQIGQMMQSQATNDDVKNYSKTLTDDHQKAQDQLQKVASQANITPQTNQKMAEKDQQLRDKLASAQGSQKDKEFLQSQVKDHKQAISQLKKMEPQVTDPQMKSYISELIPTLQKHEREANHLLQQMGGGAAGAPAGQAQPQGTEQQKPPMSEEPPTGQQNPPLF